ncbi:Hypothetical_protein [Hexamita inflata]|uniref:Hypothetical_protein n=1 Tax=Hexamita inflata TaxID=28002 RepID=A0AA86RK89_9EUKA|nr:Hypothetical protein HINF_LOCUS63761 [Hexamita inflata]
MEAVNQYIKGLNECAVQELNALKNITNQQSQQQIQLNLELKDIQQTENLINEQLICLISTISKKLDRQEQSLDNIEKLQKLQEEQFTIVTQQGKQKKKEDNLLDF